MTPSQYEHNVAEYFKKKGYSVQITKLTNDFGVDVLVRKGKAKIAVQAKMFGEARRINIEMVLQLQGAKDYFDCTKAIIATDGLLTSSANEVANKLGIEILQIPADETNFTSNPPEKTPFEKIWENYVMPLQGKIIKRDNGTTNKILKVDWTGIKRETSNKKQQNIKIEIFKKTIDYLLENGEITRSYINDEYKDRASSGVVLILGNTELFEITKRPTGLKMKKQAIT